MGSKYINKKQAKLYMKLRTAKGLTQEAAAAKADMSVRSGRDIEHSRHHTAKPQKVRAYKTRRSPIDDVWLKDLEPMLRENPDLQPKTLLIYLQRTYIDSSGTSIYADSIERTLQRKVAKWLAINGESKDIMFPQKHIPGQQGLSDFSHPKKIKITIKGVPFIHMFYHFRLVYSKWSYIKVIQTGESMQALSEGLQEALFTLGGVPKDHRTDSLSAAFKNLTDEAQEDLTKQYEELCAYYNMTPSRNNKGESHENGSVESSHGHIKNRILQELILRGNNDFESASDYQTWIHKIVKDSNKRNCKNFREEQLALQPLPRIKTINYEIKSIKVSGLSIGIIKGMKYSLPSSLSGHAVTLHIYQNEIKVYLGCSFILNLERKYYKEQGSLYVINYKHVIHALIKKPGAFRYCQYKNEIFPNNNYRRIWEHLDLIETTKAAPKIMLRLLKLAADYDCETELGVYVCQLLENKSPLIIEEIENRFNANKPYIPEVKAKQHDLSQYDLYMYDNITGETYATT